MLDHFQNLKITGEAKQRGLRQRLREVAVGPGDPSYMGSLPQDPRAEREHQYTILAFLLQCLFLVAFHNSPNKGGVCDFGAREIQTLTSGSFGVSSLVLDVGLYTAVTSIHQMQRSHTYLTNLLRDSKCKKASPGCWK